MSDDEVQNIIDLATNIPNITAKEIIECLGIKRHPVTVKRVREKHLGKIEVKYKNDISTMFSLKEVEKINDKDVYFHKYQYPFYLIEMNAMGIYLGEENGNDPCFLTPYFSMALKFDDYESAKKFIDSLDNTSKWKLNVKRVSE